MKRLTIGASLIGASLVAVGLVLWFLTGDEVESSYSSLQSAREDHLFDRRWLPDILPPSSSKIRTSNNLDLNTSQGSFEITPNEWSLLEVKLAPGSIGAPFANWNGRVADYRERGFRPWHYASSDVRWVFFCKPDVGRCEYVMWVSRDG